MEAVHKAKLDAVLADFEKVDPIICSIIKQYQVRLYLQLQLLSEQVYVISAVFFLPSCAASRCVYLACNIEAPCMCMDVESSCACLAKVDYLQLPCRRVWEGQQPALPWVSS